MVMLTKSDDRKYGYLRRYTACIFIGVGSLSKFDRERAPKSRCPQQCQPVFQVPQSQVLFDIYIKESWLP